MYIGVKHFVMYVYMFMYTCLCLRVCVYRMNTRSVQRALNSIMGHGAPSAEAMNNGVHGKLTETTIVPIL